FAFVVPLLIVLVVGIVQVATAYNHYLTVTDAARVGARDAAVGRFSGETQAEVDQSVVDAAGDLDPSQLQVDAENPNWNVSGSNVTVTVEYPYSIDIMGVVVASGMLTSAITERVE
ncbi:MAG: pilus assembly protein, partial [Actinobacteria bacterium]|nr:pilus assembly protein [Actinomycetota bacterium]